MWSDISGELSISSKIWLSKSIFYVKNDANLSIFFSMTNIILGADFLLHIDIFDNLDFSTILFFKTTSNIWRLLLNWPARLKNFLMDWLLVLGLEEGLVECATLCVKSWVILRFCVRLTSALSATYFCQEEGHTYIYCHMSGFRLLCIVWPFGLSSFERRALEWSTYWAVIRSEIFRH